jgi:hypothetical protein
MISQPPTDHIIKKVLCLAVNNQRCSGFAVLVGDHVCLVTAKHIVAHFPEARPSKIGIVTGLQSELVEIVSHFCTSAGVDVAVLETPWKADPKGDPGLELTSDNVIYGQDTYFLGFPYFDQQIKYPSLQLNNGFPLPLIKKATFSGSSGDTFFLDGHNNPGFSGGPLVLTVQSTLKQVIWGVVSGYISHFVATSTELVFEENSGIIVIYSIKHAVEIMERVYGRLPNANLIR